MNHPLLVKSLFTALLMSASFGLWLQAASVHAGDSKTVATGTWGGEHLVLEVSDKGAEAEFDCAHGQITEPIALDQRGDFDAAGTFTPEHGGPVRRGEVPPAAPARYSGHVDGDTMTLKVFRDKEEVGTFTLTRGNRPLLMKCR
jgi:hypothetical protein